MTSNRRSFLRCACVSALGVAGLGGPSLRASAASAVPPTSLTPDEALDALTKGHQAFLDQRQHPGAATRQRRAALAHGQAPYAAVLCCSDSRVAPELLLSRELGEIFTVRDAGNTADVAAMGSIEYAVAVLKVPLVLVMGHESCGAVRAAVEIVESNKTFPGHIGTMIEAIVPAALQARTQPGDWLDNAVRENVRRTVRKLQSDEEPLIQAAVNAGRLKIVGARYGLADGALELL